MKLKPVYLLGVAMLVPSNLQGQESVCHLFSHLAPQTSGRQLVLTGDLVMSKDIAVLGAWDCDEEYISDHMVRPIAVLLRPSEQVSASRRVDFEKVALKLDTLRSEGKTVSATATFSGKMKLVHEGWLAAELIFDSFENPIIEVLPDPASLPVIPICSLFQNLREHEGRRIAVRGELVTTMEGQWIVGHCQGALVTDGYRWPVALNIGSPALCSEETNNLCGAKWPSKLPVNEDYMVSGYSDGATTATFVGHLRMRVEYHAVCMGGLYPHYSGNGFGHLSGAVAELAVENVLNAEATPTRIQKDGANREAETCVPSK